MSFPQLRSRNLNQLTNQTAAQSYTLGAEAGSVSWTGTDASPTAGYRVDAASGSVGWTGTDAVLNKGFTVSAGAGSFSWTGTDANFGVSMGAEAGAFNETGTSTTLTYSQITSSNISINYDWLRDYPRAFQHGNFSKRRFEFVNTYTLSASAGDVTDTGIEATLSYVSIQTALSQAQRRRHSWPRHFAPSPWGHLTGVKSLNRIGYATTSYALNGDSGTFAWTGTDAAPKQGLRLDALAGLYSWSVVATNLNKGRYLAVDSGNFVITASTTGLSASIVGTAGVYVWTGEAATLLYSNAPETTARGSMLMGVG